MFTAMKRNLAFVIVAATIAGGGAVAYANGAPERPVLAAATSTAAAPESQSPAANGPGRANRPERRHAIGRAVHGDLVVRTKDGKFESVTFDKGTIKSVSDNKLTLVRPDGVEVTVKLDDNTKYRGVDGAAGLEIGKHAVVLSKDGTALRVGQRARDGARPGPNAANGPTKANGA
jgi:hypothetical protein